jgi:hypothetical protein
MGYDVAQWRADKAARLARGEAKPVAAASLESPAPLPAEAFKNVAAEALTPEVVETASPPVPATKPPVTSWAPSRVKKAKE